MSKAGTKIIDGLNAALAGDFASVMIEGQLWVRKDKGYFTLVFPGNIGSFPGNPLKTETPFGLPEIVGRGNAFCERDAIEEDLERHLQIISDLQDSRDALVASLKEMLRIYWGAGDGQKPDPECIINARAALAKAG